MYQQQHFGDTNRIVWERGPSDGLIILGLSEKVVHDGPPVCRGVEVAQFIVEFFQGL